MVPLSPATEAEAHSHLMDPDPQEVEADPQAVEAEAQVVEAAAQVRAAAVAAVADPMEDEDIEYLDELPNLHV